MKRKMFLIIPDRGLKKSLQLLATRKTNMKIMLLKIRLALSFQLIDIMIYNKQAYSYREEIINTWEILSYKSSAYT